LNPADRRRRIEDLCQAALDHDPATRADFVANACGTDEALLHEVEALLAHAQTAEGFLMTPVKALAAGVLTNERGAPLLGRSLGVYQISARLGAGGMGVVYRARDSKLGREVALKILPESVVHDRERVARFRREAQLLASLNHPNIAAIYGLESAEDQQFLVLELISGKTLEQRLKKGALPMEEALNVAHQIAEALEAAHDQGIIHRDLKPANIAFTADGRVKVLDFGLAKALNPIAGLDLTGSSSLTAGVSQRGDIVGTPAYMSPEQAKGVSADKRSDLWAFGVVLMEMLTGRRVFEGETIAQVLAAVMTDQPDWKTLPAATPAPIRTLLRRCLNKDPKRRIADASDAGLEIDDALAAPTVDTHRPNRWWSRMPTSTLWTMLPWGLFAVAVVGGVLISRGTRTGPLTPVYTSLDAPSDYVLGEDDSLVSLPTRTPMVFTADGRSLILQAARSHKPQLFLRSLDHADARPIAGTDDARAPFVSPDSKWIGFWAANELRKVPIEGGAPTTVSTGLMGLGPNGAAWGGRDIILFGDQSGRIMRVPAGGGSPIPVTAQPTRGRQHVAPFFLPDGTRFLFSDVSVVDASDSHLMVQALAGGDPRVLVSSATDGRLLPSGRLAFMRLGTLMTVGFDATRAEIKGDAVAAMSEVMQSGLRGHLGALNTGAGMFAVSSHGTLAAIRGPVTGGEGGPLIWVTRDGRSSSAEPAAGPPAGFRTMTRIAPDHRGALTNVITATRREWWFLDWARNMSTLCGDCSAESGVVWSPDGSRLLQVRKDTLVAHVVQGSGPDEELLRETDRLLFPALWLRDGRIVYLSAPADNTRSEINPLKWEIKLLEPGALAGRLVVPFGRGFDPDVSPDGQWLAYTSNPSYSSSREPTVVVQPFPGPGVSTQVSAGYGENAIWSTNGRTIYYLGNPETTVVYAVDITTVAGAFTASSPRQLFRRGDDQECAPVRCHELSGEGPRFLFGDKNAVTRTSVKRMDLVLNWTETLPKSR
jgi:serine/threonine protein kinase